MTPHEHAALVASIVRDGFLEPILVRPNDDDSWEVLSGNHRVMAAADAGCESIPALAIDCDDDRAARIAVNLNTIHGTADPLALTTFVARADTDTIHLDAHLRSELRGLDRHVADSLTRGSLPDEVDGRTPGA